MKPEYPAPDGAMQALIARRRRLNLSQPTTAMYASINGETLARAERGAGRPLTAHEMRRLDHVLTGLERLRKQAAAMVTST
jgi:DNA-binding transcriptional regulator YiaG